MSRIAQQLTDLIDLGTAMEVDEQLPSTQRQQQDRSISDALSQSGKDASVSTWLAQRRTHSPFTDPAGAAGAQAARGTRMASGLLVLIGVVLGWGCALAVFGYDGTTPVNVVHVIGVFVLLQLLLLIGFGLLALPERIARYVPGLRGLQNILRGFSPGHFLPLLARVLPQDYRLALNRITDRFNLNRKLYGRVISWIALEWSQRFAVAFHVGAIAGALTLTVFSDLAFGWSTTLSLGAQGFHQFTSALSVPWSWWMSSAVPSYELVENTQYFRLDTINNVSIQEASLRTQWWPFVMMCMVVYSLLPRLLTWMCSRVMLNRAIQAALTTHPGVRDVLKRLKSNRVQTQAIERTEKQRNAPETPVATVDEPLSGAALVVDWSEAAGSADRAAELVTRALQLSLGHLISVGGNRSFDEDESSFAQISVDDETNVVFIVRAWETPTLDILDTISALRARLDPHTTVCILVLENEDSRSRQDFAVWQQTLGRLSDPWLRTVGYNIDSDTLN